MIPFSMRLKIKKIILRFGLYTFLLFLGSSLLSSACHYSHQNVHKKSIPINSLIKLYIDIIKDEKASKQDKLDAMESLREIGHPAVSELIKLLNEDNKSSKESSIEALVSMGAPAVSMLVQTILTTKDERVFEDTINILAQIGADAEKAIIPLVKIYKEGNSQASYLAEYAIVKIASSLMINIEVIKYQELQPIISDLKLVEDEFKTGHIFDVNREDNITIITSAIRTLNIEYKNRFFHRIIVWIEEHELMKEIWIWIIGTPIFALLLCLIIWVFMFWLKPIQLYKISKRLGNLDVRIKWPLETTLGLRKVILLSFFHYRDRVLDAWVKEYLKKSQEKFNKLPTVEDRNIHVLLPVKIDEKKVDSFSDQELRPVFNKSRFCILIWGEGGSGKTSLACKLAKWAMGEASVKPLGGHPMIPILIEHDLPKGSEQKIHPLIEAIQTQIELILENDEISPEFLNKLLKQRRILVIVDHFSEMKTEYRDLIQPGHDKRLKINAMIITSRIHEHLEGSATTTIEPLRIDKNHLVPLLVEYLKDKSFEDDEYFDGSKRLSQIVGERGITPLLARLFADQMVASKENPSAWKLPENIPDLMLASLNRINRYHTPEELDNRAIHKILKIVAWACLEPTFKPMDGSLRVIQKEFPDEKDLDQKLKYLKEKLGIIQFIGDAEDKVRITIDPLAEYLAGLWLLEFNGSDEEKWKKFLDKADQKEGAPQSIEGFLLAVRDCCLAKDKDFNVPAFMPDELAKRANLDLEAIEKAKIRYHIQQLIMQMKSEHIEDRKYAAEALRNFGLEANDAIPTLIELLKDDSKTVRFTAAFTLRNLHIEVNTFVPVIIETLKDKDKWIRSNAAQILGKIGFEAKDALPSLIEALKDQDSFVRSSAALALGKIGLGSAETIFALIDALKDSSGDVRSSVARALGDFGPQAKEALPALINILVDKNKWARVSAAKALGSIGSDAKEAVPNLVKLMKDKKGVVRVSAKCALESIAPEVLELKKS